jgi:hypothetical protein
MDANDAGPSEPLVALPTLDRIGIALTGQLMKVVDDGLGPLTGSSAYAESRVGLLGDRERAIRRIVNETTAAAGTAGFVTGLGGFVTLPATLPANITGQAVLNARMVGSIAHLRGWDIHDEVVRNAVLIAVAGGSPNAVLAEFGVTVARKLTETAIKRLPIEIIRAINKRVGFMLIAKYGTKRSAVTLTKLVPGIGGIVGGAVDAGFTRVVARTAKRAFPRVDASPPVVAGSVN